MDNRLKICTSTQPTFSIGDITSCSNTPLLTHYHTRTIHLFCHFYSIDLDVAWLKTGNLFLIQVRFLLRSGREYEPATTESDKLSPRFLGYFLFPSSYRKQSTEPKRYFFLIVPFFTLHALWVLILFYLRSSPTLKEQNAHVASVKNILESHASYLMSGKELSKLVAFVKGTQFDLVVRDLIFFLMKNEFIHRFILIRKEIECILIVSFYY